MKRWISLLFALLLVLPVLGQAKSVIKNKISGADADFSFPVGTELLEVYFPKLDGTDAAYIRYGEYSMLLDCGGDQWRETKKLLDQLGVTHLTYAVNSHPDADHIGGFNYVLAEIPADEFLTGFPEDYPEGDEVRYKIYDALHEMDIPIRRVGNGDTIDFGDVQVSVYQRFDEELPRVNNRSIMLMFQLGERRIFFPGDIQRDTQLLLVADQANLDLKCDVLKSPHHGLNPMQYGFLKMVQPELVIITSGSSDAGMVSQLKENNIKYYFCQYGVNHLATDGEVWLVERPFQ